MRGMSPYFNVLPMHVFAKSIW